MKKLMTLMVAVVIMSMAVTAFAQPGSHDAGVFADPGAASSSIILPAFVPTFFYVLGYDMDGLVKGFEFLVQISDPAMTVLARNLQAGALNVGSQDNFIVGAGGCFPGDGLWYQMVQYQAGYFVPTPPSDTLVCLGPSTPSSFAPAVPGYLQCDGSLVPFSVAQSGGGVYPDGCGVINATDPGQVISTTAESFGAVKSKF